jgi:hypothetical protein
LGSYTTWFNYTINHVGDSSSGLLFDVAFYPNAQKAVHLIEIANGDTALKPRYFFRHPAGEKVDKDRYDMALRNGWKVAPTFNQDNHNGRWGDRNNFRSVVVLPQVVGKENALKKIKKMLEKSERFNRFEIKHVMNGASKEMNRNHAVFNKDNLLKAMSKRNVYAADLKDMKLDFRLIQILKDKVKNNLNISDKAVPFENVGIMGDFIRTKSDKLLIYIKSTNGLKYSIIGDNGKEIKPEKSNYFSDKYKAYVVRIKNEYKYIYLKAAKGKHIGVTAPIWINPTSEEITATKRNGNPSGPVSANIEAEIIKKVILFTQRHEGGWGTAVFLMTTADYHSELFNFVLKWELFNHC